MIAEAPLLLQVEDKGPYLAVAYLGYIGGESLGAEELLQIADAVGHRLYGLFALALGLGAEPITHDES